MRRIYTLLTFIIISVASFAVDIPAGTFYFDNSLTSYQAPKFVYGDNSKTYIISMTKGDDGLWSVTFDKTITNMYRYTFANTSLTDGTRDDSFTNTKEYISKTLNENRTATTDATILVGGVYTPSSSDNWTSGSWQMKSNGKGYSETLPVLFINTDNGVAITSNETYVTGTYYLDSLSCEDYKSIGTKEEPLPLSIRGRGNYTWTGFDKKPYKLKLDSKAKLMGMKKNKQFALIACADDNLAFLRNTVGFELSRRLGLRWTPAQEAVEVVLNGKYIGLYMLTENIRVDSKRVDIVEQEDSITDAKDITGGWLMEIDNYSSTPQVTMSEGNGNWLMITGHTPEIWSKEQKAYITAQMTALNKAIYTTDKTSTAWEDLIDMDELARYYVCQEIMDDEESFHGSCYLYKDKDTLDVADKWKFGPVWDFGNAYHSSNGYCQKFIWNGPQFSQAWIGEICKYPRFMAKVKEVWQKFKGNDYESLPTFIDEFIKHIATACVYDATRWPNYGTSDAASKATTFKNYLSSRIAWLTSQWGEGVSGIQSPEVASAEGQLWIAVQDGEVTIESDEDILSVSILTIDGRMVDRKHTDSRIVKVTSPKSGIYVISATLKDGKHITKKVLVK